MKRIKEGLHLSMSKATREFIDSCEKVYLIGCWARVGMIEYPYAGKIVKDDIFGYTPLVFDFDDHNGTMPEYVVRKIQDVTTGVVKFYSFNEEKARELVALIESGLEKSSGISKGDENVKTYKTNLKNK